MKLSPSQLAALHFIKSSYSGNDQSQCVEVAPLAPIGLDGVAVQDTKLQGGPTIVLGPAAFKAFLGSAVRDGVR
ncbi:DUF397 domain-containing protein [Streptomyces lavendulae]|uniref:DUF397 domain-containing protein n=1 Tax=Streptomyces lavendulae TaxID=1914 RepID=UPI0024A06C33|nr:DUF397 domain-containing protein [Streptomyces lavendulae]GLW04788.1 hypothetical protein Slala05_84180 [Streptomyces lavendulae subsp. lavendulae]